MGAGAVAGALTPAEIAAACARYDLGAIREIRHLPRGSALAPKAVLATGRGTFVLKRRAASRSREEDIGFSHAIQSRLAAHQFPLPRLVCARDGRTFVRIAGACVGAHAGAGKLTGGAPAAAHAYELFEFVRGHRFGADVESARAAGAALALYHHLLASAMDHLEAIGYSMRRPTSGLYHDTPDFGLRMQRVRAALLIPASAAAASPPTPAGRAPAAPTAPTAPTSPTGPAQAAHETGLLCERIEEMYHDAAARTGALGVASFPVQIIHGDWHPGNMLFQGDRIAAVLDHDNAGVGQRILDIANGALQFSLRAKGAPEVWPAEPDRGRLRAFMRGLDEGPGGPISEGEIHAVPWLMLQALVIEGVTPVAATGAFGGRPPLGPLLMIERKAAWLRRFAREVVSEIG